MAELSGELIAHPLPNEPGRWVYRKLHNGVLLLVELSKEEWVEFHLQHRQKQLDKIRGLDEHPLNIAASTLLVRADRRPLGDEISLISLGRFALDEDVMDWDDGLIALNEWGRSPGTMQKAIWVLEQAQVTPEDLLSLTLEDAAQLVLEHLVGEDA